jgi:hypothetical protein
MNRMSELSSGDRETAYRRATERVRARLGFYGHVALFIVVGALLLAINLLATPEAVWFFWPLLFWAAALAAHAVVVFGPGMGLIERWRDREFEQELTRMRSRGVKSEDGEDAAG